jgi:drug/metabolite transporter (DMT)-like permease
MLKGIVFALAACFIWGLIFIVPQFMDGFSAVEIAIGRYTFFGTISILLLLKAWLQNTCRYPLAIWFKALYFAVASSFGYYICLVLGLRYSSPAICALILGISPISIAFYGNWKQKECSFKSLILPSILIFVGLVIINYPHFIESDSPSNYALGLLCAFCSLMIWSWYVVANSKFLKDHPEVLSSDWSTLMGVSTMFGVAIMALFFGIFVADQEIMEKYKTFNPALVNFLLGSATLGFMCSWVGGFLWNRASVYLPVALAGQMTIFETIFGLIFVCLLEQRVPPYMECFGIALLLTAIVFGIRLFSKTVPQETVT